MGESPRPPKAACGRNDAKADRRDDEVKFKAAKPPSAPAPCRSGVRGRSAPAAGGYLRAERPAHKPNRRFGRGARTVCCANAQKDRAPEGARFPLSATLTARILTRVRGSGQSLGRNYKAALPPSAPAPCRSGSRGASPIRASHRIFSGKNRDDNNFS